MTPANSLLAVLTAMINFKLFVHFWAVSTTLGKIVIAGVNGTANKLSPVSTTPPINFSQAINCIDDRGLFFLQIGENRWYLLPPKSDTAADGAADGTAMKSCIHRHIWIRGPWGRQNYFKPKRQYFFWFGQPQGPPIRMHQVPMDATFHGSSMAAPLAAVSDFGGLRYHQFVPFNFHLSLAAPHLHGALFSCHRQWIYRQCPCHRR